MNEKWLATGIDAIRAWGDENKARSILREYVAHHAEDERGWYWLSQVADGPAEEAACLKRLLEFKTKPALVQAQPIQLEKTRSIGQPHAIGVSTRPHRIFQLIVYSFIGLIVTLITVAVLPMFTGNRTIVILSGSMSPTIAEGDAVIAVPVPSSELIVGDIIAYNANPNSAIPVVHRIISIKLDKGVRYYTTRGDANKSADVTPFMLPATAWKMSFAVPLAGYAIALAASKTGTLLLIIVPIVLLGILQIRNWLKRRPKNAALAGTQAI
jgi:signal peptidase I